VLSLLFTRNATVLQLKIVLLVLPYPTVGGAQLHNNVLMEVKQIHPLDFVSVLLGSSALDNVHAASCSRDVVNAICILQIVDGALKIMNANPYLGSDKDWGHVQKLKIARVLTTPLVILVWKEEIVSGAETKPRV